MLNGAVIAIAVAVAADTEERAQTETQWETWNHGVPLEVIISPSRALVRSVEQYVQTAAESGKPVTVLICEVQPHRHRHDILNDQRGLVLATALRAHTDVVVATLPYRLHD